MVRMIDKENNIITYKPIHQRVLVVAVSRPYDGEGAWCAYIADVPGESHKNEYLEVARNGEKLSELVAKSIFVNCEFTSGRYIL